MSLKKHAFFWDLVSLKYDKRNRRFEKVYTDTIEKCLPYIHDDQQVLDVACGTGIITLEIAKKSHYTTAVDISSGMLKVIRDKARKWNIENISFIQGDIFTPALEGRKFDVIMLMNAFHYFRYPENLINRIRSLLNDNGTFFVSMDCLGENYPSRSGFLIKTSRLLSLLHLIPFMKFYKISDVNQLFGRKGFTLIESYILMADPPHYFAIFRPTPET